MKCTNNESTFHNIATLILQNNSNIHVSSSDTLVATMTIFTATCVGMVV